MDRKKCMSCEGNIWLYELVAYDYDENNNSSVSHEVFCNECLANILQEDPTCIISINRIEESF